MGFIGCWNPYSFKAIIYTTWVISIAGKEEYNIRRKA